MCKKLCTLLLSLSFFVSGAITASAMDTQSVKESNITSRVFGTIGILDQLTQLLWIYIQIQLVCLR